MLPTGAPVERRRDVGEDEVHMTSGVGMAHHVFPIFSPAKLWSSMCMSAPSSRVSTTSLRSAQARVRSPNVSEDFCRRLGKYPWSLPNSAHQVHPLTTTTLFPPSSGLRSFAICHGRRSSLQHSHTLSSELSHSLCMLRSGLYFRSSLLRTSTSISKWTLLVAFFFFYLFLCNILDFL